MDRPALRLIAALLGLLGAASLVWMFQGLGGGNRVGNGFFHGIGGRGAKLGHQLRTEVSRALRGGQGKNGVPVQRRVSRTHRAGDAIVRGHGHPLGLGGGDGGVG